MGDELPASASIPPWRTSTVMALCDEMKRTRDFSAMPILADALQDADYADERNLTYMRGSAVIDQYDALRLIAEVLGGEYADAVVQMEKLVVDLGDNVGHDPDYYPDSDQKMTFAFLMERADITCSTQTPEKWGHGETFTQHGSEHWRNTFPASAFWGWYTLITGTHPIHTDNNVFSCSC